MNMTGDLAMAAVPAPKTDRWTDAFLDTMRQEADPEADGIIRDYFQSFPSKEAGRAALIALKKTYLDNWDLPMPQDLPPTVRAFFDKPVKYPLWVDPRRIDIASELFMAYGPVSILVLLLKSWPSLLTNEGCAHAFWVAQIFSRNFVAQQLRQMPSFILNFTMQGQLAQTLTTWPSQTVVPGLPPGVSIYKARGIITIQKLRMAHAVQRIFLMQKHPKPEANWDRARLGAPINQEDLCQTMLHLCLGTIDGLAALGITQNEGQQDATLMAWKTVLFLLGLHEDMQPRDLAEARLLLEANRRRHKHVTSDAQDLIQGELGVANHLLPWGLKSVPAAMMRYLVGKELSDALKVPNPRFLLWLIRSSRWLWKGNKLLLLFISWLSPRIIRGMEAASRFADTH
jgi:hypothetical protein